MSFLSLSLVSRVFYVVFCNALIFHVFNKMKSGRKNERKERANTLSIEYICYILFTYLFIFVYFRLMLYLTTLLLCVLDEHSTSTVYTLHRPPHFTQNIFLIVSVSVVNNNLIGIFFLIQIFFLRLLKEAFYLHKLHRMNNKIYTHPSRHKIHTKERKKRRQKKNSALYLRRT